MATLTLASDVAGESLAVQIGAMAMAGVADSTLIIPEFWPGLSQNGARDLSQPALADGITASHGTAVT